MNVLTSLSRFYRFFVFCVICVLLLLIAFSPQTLGLQVHELPELEPLPSLVPRDSIYGAAMSDGQLWLAGNYGKIIHRAGPGAALNRQPTPIKEDLMDIEAWDGKRLVAVGDSGTVLRTSDGGSSWSVVKSAYGDRINMRGINKLLRVDVQAGGHAWAVGQWNMVMESSDYGKSWSRISESRDQNVYGVSAVGTDTVVSVGEFGEIFRGTRTGTGSDSAAWSWTSIESPTDQSLKAVDFRNASNGVAVGLRGIVLRTTDGGRTWDLVREQNTNHLFHVLWTGEEWVATGSGGTLVSAGPGAESWTSESLAPTEYGWHTEILHSQDPKKLVLVGTNQGTFQNGEWTLLSP